MINQLTKLQKFYLTEERSVLLDCLERNKNSNFPYDLSKFWSRIEKINQELK